MFDRGAHEEDGPMIWEIPFISHEEKQAKGEPVTDESPVGFGARVSEIQKKKYPLHGWVKGKGNRSLRFRMNGKSEDCIRAMTPGNKLAARTR